ncbi:HD family phosphohydrolase [Ferroacidibacillus organovorans]|uniref:HD/PDEase domain-containing protein n=1 Tax=Ferroacidibacillus organovorans TaxID=1765683 RepID=A0A853KBH3_9BACL|nr:HDIG domain-containing metalloprotein [Ferroacidibacillus organovorans]KYP81040.1 hypothetical protein AYJ22_08895 [Ferroacidibacillus organovorans]OAG93704.1 hypothetical protein AYW79_09355 [Ferroacidibacillus organovorans]
MKRTARTQNRLIQFLTSLPFHKSRRMRAAIYGELVVVIYALLIGAVLPQRYSFSVGQVSQSTIVAPTDAVDTYATQQARIAAAQQVSPRYDVNPAIEQSAVSILERLFVTTQTVLSDKSLTMAERLLTLKASAPPGVDGSVFTTLLQATPLEFNELSGDSIRIVQTVLGGPFSASDMKNAAMMIDQQLVTLDVNIKDRMAIAKLLLAVVKPNLVYDPVLTQQARLNAERNVPDVWINRGDVILRRGQLVTPATLSQMKDLKMLKNEPDYAMEAGYLLFVLLLVIAIGIFIQMRRGRIAKDNLHLLLYALLLTLLIVLIRVSKTAVNAGFAPSLVDAVPFAMGSMMISLFFGTSLALLSSLLVALLASSAYGFAFAPFFVALMGSLGATMATSRVQNRGVFMRAGFLAAGINFAAIGIMHLLIPSSTSIRGVSYDLLYGVVGGLLSGIFSIGLMPYLETIFRVTTHIGLLELANPNHPLLRRLLLEAPGTYHHSLIVGNLAESAAEAIGADALICRVGAYFHDVGKMRRPAFFIENQIGGDNPHDKVAASLSYLIVTSHVSDGLAMLNEYRLPEPVTAICAQHHGTTVLWYFYNKAVEEDKHAQPDIDQFRYPGPKPQSREAAIVMICDAVEAAVRSMQKPTPPRIEAMIRKIIKDRLQDGQLDQCDITLRDLDKMTAAFMRTLQGVYHERIEYPDPEKLLAQKNR